MAYLNFSEALSEAKRKAALQGREVSQQEAAGLSKGIAESAQENAVEWEALEQNKEQYEKGLEENKRQFDTSLAEQMKNAEREYNLSVDTLTAQIAQYKESSEIQRAQFGQQMEFQIAESARAAERWKKEFDAAKTKWQEEYDLLKKQTDAQIAAANNAGGGGGGCCIIASVVSNPEWYPLMGEADRETIDRAKADLITGKRTTEEIIAQCKDAYGKIGGYAISITRIYRDTYMPKTQLRGYYMIAEQIVPRMLRERKWMEWARRNIVDNVVPYCEWRMGIRSRLRVAKIVKAKAFLWLCSLVGSTRASFTRCNGEVF